MQSPTVSGMDSSAGTLFLLVTSILASCLAIVFAVLLCSWCFGKKDDSGEEDSERLAEKYMSGPSKDDGVRMLNKRSWEERNSPALSRKTISILDGLLDRFERPGRNHQVVTEPVQPSLATHTSLHESLGSRSSTGSNYQTMTPAHKAAGGTTSQTKKLGDPPLSQSNSKNSQSSDDVNSSLWKGMRNIAFTLMDNAEEEGVESTAPDPTEGVDCQLGKIQFSISYDFQNLTLSLKILQAQNLPAKDFTGTSDPYVKILFLPDKKHKLMTKVKKKNLNPRWNECFLFEGWPHNKLLEKTIYLQVIDYDRFSRDDPIGETYIPLNTIDLTLSPTMWRYLQPCKDSRGKLGEILLSLCYQPAIGRLTVIVMKCKDLKAKDITGASDPYVKLWLMYGNTRVEKKKTSIKMRTLNPVYNESFIYDIPWDKIREAAIEIIVMDFDKVGRNEMIGKILLSSKSGPLETRHWNDMITKPRQAVAQWHLLKD